MNMTKLIRGEWIKFTQNRKNRILILLLTCYLLGSVFYFIKADKDYYIQMEEAMREQKREASNRLETITKLEEEEEDYESNPKELEYLDIENTSSLMLEHYYSMKDLKDWERMLETENEKYNNLILGEEKGFIEKHVLKARSQYPTELKREIAKNEYLIKNNIKPYFTPYELNGMQFLTFLLEGYSPMILIIFCAILSIDIFLGELEEGSYKLCFTQPYNRKKIYWAKIFSVLLFVIGIMLLLMLLFFIIISLIYGVGSSRYPRAIGILEILTSLSSNTGKLGQFQIISTSKYLFLGYILLFFMMIMTILSTITLSTWINSLSNTLGLVTGLMMLNYVFESFLENDSILRFYFPLSYFNIEGVVSGQVNASYIIGVIFALIISTILTITNYKTFMKRDLLGAKS
ncbi:MAG TPA: ABC transporter permease [Tissierellales bacterium]|nr:ABC transporter permease [Tissierellales bacterium]